jgi:hypothetical protein
MFDIVLAGITQLNLDINAIFHACTYKNIGISSHDSCTLKKKRKKEKN